MSASAVNPGDSKYELRFRSLFKPGRGLSFACDSNGRVDIDALSEHARCNYLYARTVIGREFFMPEVLPAIRIDGSALVEAADPPVAHRTQKYVHAIFVAST